MKTTFNYETKIATSTMSLAECRVLAGILYKVNNGFQESEEDGHCELGSIKMRVRKDERETISNVAESLARLFFPEKTE